MVPGVFGGDGGCGCVGLLWLALPHRQVHLINTSHLMARRRRVGKTILVLLSCIGQEGPVVPRVVPAKVR